MSEQVPENTANLRTFRRFLTAEAISTALDFCDYATASALVFNKLLFPRAIAVGRYACVRGHNGWPQPSLTRLI
jgi:hypothetical protein